MKLRPMGILLIMLAGWINRHQQDAIEYLKAENKILRDKIGKKRIILNDEQRMYLALLGRKLGRKVLSDICCAFSPDTILRWHRDLIAKKYDGSARRGLGRPRLSEALERLILKVAKHNRHWGYGRIVGQLKYLGFKVSHQTIGNIIKNTVYSQARTGRIKQHGTSLFAHTGNRWPRSTSSQKKFIPSRGCEGIWSW